ncbi:hypothetical protein [Streptomyces sp. CBMA156]|uniref:hypothetical protein n=1 Tax=Streptomyces sp. CBMA156 TaxID=1930280 RepID=UPI001661F056|nr:hypothetical protein [Streptomyces sp. CBMA156]MBD0675046.1 hypothetical protein [Streptomyces sp. CBMA156]
MADFKVSTEFLAKLAQDLKGCGDELEQGLKAFEAAGHTGTGFDFLDEACGHFRDTWQFGLKKVRECVTVLDEGLEQVRQNYDGTEQSIVKVLAPAGRS